MKISTKGRYALRIMIDLGLNSNNQPVRVKDIAKRQEISDKYLEQIISILNRAGYVKSIRGSQGGYLLCKKPCEYTVGMILRLTEGNLSPVSCLEDEVNLCSRKNECATLILWHKLDYAIKSVVDHYTLEDLISWHCNNSNNHIIAANNIYGGTYNLLAHTLPEYGITTTFFNPFDNDHTIEDIIQENTKAIYIETLGNPNSDVVDIERLAKIAHKHNIPLVVDNTFATPYLVRPIEYGADIVVHSATKFIGGHGTSIGGVIIDSGKFDWESSGKFSSLVKPNPSYHGISFTKAVGPAAFVTKIRAILLRDTGATISPFNSFLFLQGLETLSLRVERHVENALKVVKYLNNHPLVEKVHHPSVSSDPSQQSLYKKYFPNGGGSIFTFEIKGDAQVAKDFIDNLELFSLLANVADVKSLVIHPASTTHSQLNEKELLEQGIKPNTIRLSIGTENIDDIIQDLEEAFKVVYTDINKKDKVETTAY